jgi:hypothetical protein
VANDEGRESGTLSTDTGYFLMSHGWPAGKHSPALSYEDVCNVREIFGEIYDLAMADLKESDIGDYMTIIISIPHGDGSWDELRSLREFLVSDDSLRVRVAVVQPPANEENLGGVIDALSVGLLPGGALTILAGATISWLRQRTTDLTIKITRGDKAVELGSKRIKSLDATQIRALTESLTAMFDNQEEDRDNDDSRDKGGAGITPSSGS